VAFYAIFSFGVGVVVMDIAVHLVKFSSQTAGRDKIYRWI